MTDEVFVRSARTQDATAMAQIHVRSWRETYRGLMADHVLDDPGLMPTRERFWLDVLTNERWAANTVAVAERAGAIIGIAMSGPVHGEPWSKQLFVLYLLAEHHGSGAGSALLHSVIDRSGATALWVADPNPRAQAFYRKHGFVPDGASKVEDDIREIRMVSESTEVGAVPWPRAHMCTAKAPNAPAAFPAPMMDSGDPYRPPAHSRQVTSRTTVALP